MRITGAGCVIIGPEGRTPPLPFVTVPTEEGDSLIALKLAIAFNGDAPEPEVDAEAEAAALAAAEAEAAEAAAEDALREEAEAELAALNAAEAEAARVAAEAEANANTGEGGDTNPGEGDAAAERATTISDALDLVEEAGLVKTGERAGKPKVSAIEDITGLKDVTADEIDAAIAAKDSAD